MHSACACASASSALARSMWASRLSACFVTPSADDGARARYGAIQRGDDGTPALSQREDEIAREASELEQPCSVACEQRPDDVLHVAARAERPPGPGDDHGPDPRLAVQRAEGVAQLAVDVKGQGVESIRTIERDGGNAGVRVVLVEEGLGRERHAGISGVGQGSTAVASISTVARVSASARTSTSVMAG